MSIEEPRQKTDPDRVPAIWNRLWLRQKDVIQGVLTVLKIAATDEAQDHHALLLLITKM